MDRDDVDEDRDGVVAAEGARDGRREDEKLKPRRLAIVGVWVMLCCLVVMVLDRSGCELLEACGVVVTMVGVGMNVM